VNFGDCPEIHPVAAAFEDGGNRFLFLLLDELGKIDRVLPYAHTEIGSSFD